MVILNGFSSENKITFLLVKLLTRYVVFRIKVCMKVKGNSTPFVEKVTQHFKTAWFKVENMHHLLIPGEHATTSSAASDQQHVSECEGHSVGAQGARTKQRHRGNFKKCQRLFFK